MKAIIIHWLDTNSKKAELCWRRCRGLIEFVEVMACQVCLCKLGLTKGKWRWVQLRSCKEVKDNVDTVF